MTGATFAELFDSNQIESPISLIAQTGSTIQTTVKDITAEFVVVESPDLKSVSYIPIAQFLDDNLDLEIKIGDQVDVVLDTQDDGWGEPRLSREKAKRAEAWRDLVIANETNATVSGTVLHKVRGGFTVEIRSIRAFLPGSQVDVRPIRELEPIEGKEFDFKVTKIDQKRNNIVVSRKSTLIDTEQKQAEKLQRLESLEEGQIVEGVIKNLTDYGAFVDLGGVDGLLHITDMAWKRVKHPSEMVTVGQTVQVKILKFDKEKSRVSLGLKQLSQDPWKVVSEQHPVGSRLTGKIASVTDYGCFVSIAEGVEGLVHVSEMDWTNKNVHPAKLVKIGDPIEVLVLEIDESRRRISLGLKQCKENPWDAFALKYQKNDKVTGVIKSITDFGLFVGLDGGIDGLVHASDLSWTENHEQALAQYEKGQSVDVVILSIDPERERVSLGIKQLEKDSFTDYMRTFTKGSVVSGKVIALEPKVLTLELAEQVEGILRASEVSREGENQPDLTTLFNMGDTVEAKIISIDRKNRQISLSIRAKELQEEKAALSKLRKESRQSSATLGDLIKDSMFQSSQLSELTTEPLEADHPKTDASQQS